MLVYIASFFLKGSERFLGIVTHLKIDGSSPIRGVGWKIGYLAVSTARKLSIFEVFDPKKINNQQGSSGNKHCQLGAFGNKERCCRHSQKQSRYTNKDQCEPPKNHFDHRFEFRPEPMACSP